MNVKLTKADREHISVLENLMQFYIYDFSEFVELDVKEDGLFESYAGLREYWDNENEQFPYFIKAGERYVGFVLVRYIGHSERNYFSMAEFFVMRKYRGMGIGRSIAEQVFNLHKGQWQIYQKESNRPAQVFWRKIIGDYTKGQFKERSEHGKRIQEFEI